MAEGVRKKYVQMQSGSRDGNGRRDEPPRVEIVLHGAKRCKDSLESSQVKRQGIIWKQFAATLKRPIGTLEKAQRLPSPCFGLHFYLISLYIGLVLFYTWLFLASDCSLITSYMFAWDSLSS